MNKDPEKILQKTALKKADEGFKSALTSRIKEEMKKSGQKPAPAFFSNRLAIVNTALLILIVVLLIPIFLQSSGNGLQDGLSDKQDVQKISGMAPALNPQYIRARLTAMDDGRIQCSACGGSGKCPSCHPPGSGIVVGGETCPVCNGAGVCTHCNGQGDY